MRLQLDAKLLYPLSEQKLIHALGKEFMARLKFYIKKFYEREQETSTTASSTPAQGAYDTGDSRNASARDPLAALSRIAAESLKRMNGAHNRQQVNKHVMMNNAPVPVVEPYSEPSGVYVSNVNKLKS